MDELDPKKILEEAKRIIEKERLRTSPFITNSKSDLCRRCLGEGMDGGKICHQCHGTGKEPGR